MNIKVRVIIILTLRYNNKSVVRFLSLARVKFCPESYPAGAWRTDSSGERFVKTNNGLIYEGHKVRPCVHVYSVHYYVQVAVEEVGRVHIGHLVQLGVADFSEKWALLFTEAPKELPDRNISLVVIDMASMAIRHIIKVRNPRIS